MTLLRYQPWSLVGRLHRELDQVLGDSAPVALIPRAESRELADRYQLRADLPGVQPQDIEITAADGVLTIKAARKSWALESNSKSGGETSSEPQTAWTYQRSFTLPEDANTDAIEARSAHGVLEVSVARQAKVQPRRIQVAAA
jgi:HSP20 family protein